MVDLRDLLYLHMLGKCESIAAAARSLGVDHATVSRRLANLERATQMNLLLRSGKKCRLTHHGLAMANLAEPLMLVSKKISEYTTKNGSIAALNVRLNCLPLVACHIIAPSLSRLNAEMRPIQVQISASSNVSSLDENETDISIGLVRPTAAHIIVSRLGKIIYGWYGSSTYLIRHPEEWEFIAFGDRLRHTPHQAWIENIRNGRPIALVSDEMSIQMAAAEAGIGLALLPRLIAETNGKLKRVEFSDTAPSRDLWISYHPDRKHVASIRMVVDHIRTTFRAITTNSRIVS
ncbi:LysR family transcriptional regulator [Gluconobacter potus]|uniref:LysR family transcriptional regulator n=1 Tax=Gluconobacter potus TaxID=2724927 RepID=UPI0039EC3D78